MKTSLLLIVLILFSGIILWRKLHRDRPKNEHHIKQVKMKKHLLFIIILFVLSVLTVAILLYGCAGQTI